MDTVTYPNADVAAMIDERFSPLKINLFDRHPDFKEVISNTKVLWSPALIFSDGSGRELRRYIGWLPPASFLAELRFAVGMNEIYRTRFDEARDRFQEILDRHDDSEAAPEAWYWHGIAAFLAGNKDMDALRASWTTLVEKFPGNRFATHASVIEDA